MRQVVFISRMVTIATFERLLSGDGRAAESMMMKTVLPAKMNYHWPPADQEGEAARMVGGSGTGIGCLLYQTRRNKR